MSEPTSEKFIVRDPQGNIFGPADVDMLRRWVTEGRIVPGMAIAPRNTSDWTEASVHPATADLLQLRIRQIMESQSLPAAPTTGHSPVTHAPISAVCLRPRRCHTSAAVARPMRR